MLVTVYCVRVVNAELGFILFSFFYILFSYFILDIGKGYSVMSCMMITQVIQSHDTEKNIKGSGIGNIIQHNNSMLIL